MQTVELLCLTQRAPLLLTGTLSPLESGQWQFSTTQSIPFDVIGTNAIVNLLDAPPSDFDENSEMQTLIISEQEQQALVLSIPSKHPREKRAYPRLFTQIFIRVAPVQSETDIEEWLKSSAETTSEDWIAPEPFMNFSANGVALNWHHPLPPNQKLLIALSETADMKQSHHGLGRVIRSSEMAEDSFEIAIYFENLPQPAIDYLIRLSDQLESTLF